MKKLIKIVIEFIHDANIDTNMSNSMFNLDDISVRYRYYNDYLNPKELLKMATTNVCCSEINHVVEKSLISAFEKGLFL